MSKTHITCHKIINRTITHIILAYFSSENVQINLCKIHFHLLFLNSAFDANAQIFHAPERDIQQALCIYTKGQKTLVFKKDSSLAISDNTSSFPEESSSKRFEAKD